MECFTCHTVCDDDARFCSNCGRSFRPRGARDSAEAQSATALKSNPYPHQTSATQWVALNQELERQERVAARFWFVPLFVFGALFGQFMFGSLHVALLAGIALGFTSRSFVHRPVRKAHYYEIAHSRDGQGNHRCIFCGNRGIYKKGQYATQNTHSHCSKCEKLLFSE